MSEQLSTRAAKLRKEIESLKEERARIGGELDHTTRRIGEIKEELNTLGLPTDPEELRLVLQEKESEISSSLTRIEESLERATPTTRATTNNGQTPKF